MAVKPVTTKRNRSDSFRVQREWVERRWLAAVTLKPYIGLFNDFSTA